ncbi:MAG: hypothetical protein PVI30_24860 [Myxococcales bacterium]
MMPTARPARLAPFIAPWCAALLLAGCSQKVQSVEVSLESVSPDLICRAQRADDDLVMTLSGDGFTPQPVNVIEGEQRLILPTVRFDRVRDLGGAEVGDSGDRTFPGDPQEDYSENLDWVDDATLRVHVTEEDAFQNALRVDLLPGIYDVGVENPDGEQAATLAGALAVVDPPSVTSVAPVPPALCVVQDERVLEITGSDFVTVDGASPTVSLSSSNGGTVEISGEDVVAEDCTEPPGDYAGTPFGVCGKLTVTLPGGGSLPAGPYGLRVTSAPPADCTSSEIFDVLIVDPPSVAAVMPTATCVADGARQIALGGSSFARVAGDEPTVTLTDASGAQTEVAGQAGACAAQSTPGTDFMTDLCTELSFEAGSGLAAGTYTIMAENPAPVGCESEETAELLVVAPPSIAAVEPASVCLDGEQVALAITGDSFATVGAAEPVVTVTDAGGGATDYAPDSVGGCGETAGSAGGEAITLCTELSVTLPADVAAGAYTVAVTNPAPIDCQASSEAEVLLLDRPEVTAVMPVAVCLEGMGVPVSVEGSGFVRIGDALPALSLTDAGGSATAIDADAATGCGDPIGTLGGEDVRVCAGLDATVPSDLMLDDYAVAVTNPAPLSCTSDTSAPLVVTTPPVVDSVSPTQICSGGSKLTISGSGFRSGATVTVLCSDGGGDPHVVDSLASEASGDGTSLSLRFGFGAIPGETCDVIVANATSCESAAPHPQIDAVQGPIVFNSAPPVVYNGITTQIKLFMTAITGTPEVEIVPSGQVSGGTVLTSMVDPGNDRRIQALVPQDTSPGTYDILVSDDEGCAATLVDGLVVTDSLSIALDRVVQPFGLADEDQGVTIFRVPGMAEDNVPFSPTPSAFLNPQAGSGSDAAVQLVGVTYVDEDTLTAVVPAGVALGDYDLVVVDADGNVGVLTDAYTAVDTAPPTIENVFPQSIVNSDSYDAPGGGNVAQELTVFGDDFDTASVALLCESPDGMSVAPASVGSGTEVCDVDGCSLTVVVDGSGLSPGDVCLVRVENGDGSYADYSAVGVTNPSRNLSNPSAGQDMNTARRAPAAGAVQATSAARFVYAIGGDGGPETSDAPFDSAELAPVGVFGGMRPFVDNREQLNQARAFAGSVTIGRYIYVFGGTDGSDALASAERALVLSPAEVPVITDIDLCLSGGASDCFGTVPSTDGLLTGEYAYRISAVIDPASSRNLGGETLASDPIIIRLPEIVAAGETRRVAVQLFWEAPVDNLGDPLEDIIGYRIYRTPADGVAAADELLIGEVDETTFEFVDGGIDVGTDQPLPQGSTSAWQSLPDMNVARNALAGAAARDPDSPTGHFIYALLGMDNGDTDALDGNALSSFEYLEVQTLDNGRQDLLGGWTTGTDTTSLDGRFLHGAWVADEQVFTALGAGETLIYVGGGRDAPGNSGVLGSVEVLAVQTDGDLVYEAGNPAQASEPSRTGFSTLAAFGRLFVLGGADPMPRASASSAQIIARDELSTSFNNEGVQLIESRFVAGSTVQSAFLFVLGGQTTMSRDNMGGISGGDVTASTEYIVW